MRNILLYFCIVLCSLLCFTGCSHSSYLEADDETDVSIDGEAVGEEENASSDVPASESVFVQVAGAVNSPGVYELSSGARIYEAIEAAGGLCEDADDIDLNQAALLSDGQKIYVYRNGEREENASSDNLGGTAASADSGLININTASVDELKTLSGIGDSKANSIISYREDNGGFKSIEDLMNVDGIGEGTFAKIKDQITI